MRFKEYIKEMAKVNKGEIIGKSPQEFDKALKKFLDGAQKIINDYTRKNLENLNPNHLEAEEGPRYIRIAMYNGTVKGDNKPYHKDQKSAWGFIDKGTGDILKPASWKAPAKHPRGNIFDQKNGLGAVTLHGSIAYMR